MKTGDAFTTPDGFCVEVQSVSENGEWATIAYQRSGDIGGIRTGRVAIPFPPDWERAEKE